MVNWPDVGSSLRDSSPVSVIFIVLQPSYRREASSLSSRGGGLLLSQAVECPQSPHQIHRVYANHCVARERLSNSVERDAISWIIECRYKNGTIGYVKIDVAGRKPFAIHGYGARKG